LRDGELAIERVAGHDRPNRARCVLRIVGYCHCASDLPDVSNLLAGMTINHPATVHGVVFEILGEALQRSRSVPTTSPDEFATHADAFGFVSVALPTLRAVNRIEPSKVVSTQRNRAVGALLGSTSGTTPPR